MSRTNADPAAASGPSSFNYSIDVRGELFHNMSTYLQIQQFTKRGAAAVFGNSSSWFENTSFIPYETGRNVPCAINDTCYFSLNSTIHGGNSTDEEKKMTFATWQLIFLGILAGGTSLMTILGNLIVILSFVVERAIRQPTNYFILSLAVSDMIIGTFSMPFYTVYLLTEKYWPLGEFLCDLWLSLDYTACLTSIYTVFCITIDRYCSVKIPAKYRNWRSENKVMVMIAFTWIIPVMVFFTSIFGWQYFVGERTVPPGMCYVQYMEDPLFNLFLQIGYFWVTLTVMCVLYTGIYKVALDLQRKSEAKHKKMTSLVSMAGQTMTKIGIGMSQQRHIDGEKLFNNPNQPQENHHTNDNSTKPKRSKESKEERRERKEKERKEKRENKAKRKQHSTSFTSNNNSNKNKDDDERSSSPAFPSDTDPSSQSPKRGGTPNPDIKSPTTAINEGNGIKGGASLTVPGMPPTGHVGNCVGKTQSGNVTGNTAGNTTGTAMSNIQGGQVNAGTECSTPTLSLNSATPKNYGSSGGDVFTFPDPVADLPPPPDPEEFDDGTMDTLPLPPPPPYSNQCSFSGSFSGYSDTSGEVPDSDDTHRLSDCPTLAIRPPPKPPMNVLSLQNPDLLKSGENLAFVDEIDKQSSKSALEEPDSPVWKKRDSFVAREAKLQERERQKQQQQATHEEETKSPKTTPAKVLDTLKTKVMPNKDKSRKGGSSGGSSGTSSDVTGYHGEASSVVRQPGPSTAATAGSNTAAAAASAASLTVESCKTGDKRTVSKLTKPDEIQPLNADDGGSQRRRRLKNGSPLRGIVKTVSGRRSKKKKNKEEKESRKSKSENRARKALRTITIILGAFVICWTPWHICSMILGFTKLCDDKDAKSFCMPPILYDISYWLCYLNSPINPFCYAFANQQFKKTFIRILKFDWHKT